MSQVSTILKLTKNCDNVAIRSGGNGSGTNRVNRVFNYVRDHGRMYRFFGCCFVFVLFFILRKCFDLVLRWFTNTPINCIVHQPILKEYDQIHILFTNIRSPIDVFTQTHANITHKQGAKREKNVRKTQILIVIHSIIALFIVHYFRHGNFKTRLFHLI